MTTSVVSAAAPRISCMAPDPQFALMWPRTLFEWEAKRILALVQNLPLHDTIALLLREAFSDSDVEALFKFEAGSLAGVWSSALRSGLPTQVALTSPDAGAWLKELLKTPARLQPYREPIYWAQRTQVDETANTPDNSTQFPWSFFRLINELQETGYFPHILPVTCVDDRGVASDEWIAEQIGRAIHATVPWPINDEVANELHESTLFSLIEYFHDQAQRPRTSYWHQQFECGWYYDNFNRESGQVVYRWRVNTLLEEYRSSFRLGSQGPERGRLVRHFGSPLDELADDQVEQHKVDKDDEVLNAVQMFRRRSATLAEKRAALHMLAKTLEGRRQSIKSRLDKPDESYLFDVANNFMIRHNNERQRSDYDDEFVDWIFWNFLATVQLLERIEGRPLVHHATNRDI